MCIKLSYIHDSEALLFLLRQTPVGVEESPLREISHITLQGNDITLPQGSRYFAAIDTAGGGTSCLVHIQLDHLAQNVEHIVVYTVQNGNPDFKAVPETKLTRGVLPFYCALFGNEWKEQVAGYSFDSFYLYRDGVRCDETGMLVLERTRWSSERDANNMQIITQQDPYIGTYTDEKLQIDMSYKIGELYDAKMSHDRSILASTLEQEVVKHCIDTQDCITAKLHVAPEIMKKLGYFENVTVHVQENVIDVQALSSISLYISKQHGNMHIDLIYANQETTERCRYAIA